MEFYANLHLHSTHSDGVYSPAELVRVAKAEGYKALAISDHDTGSAYPELVKACEEEGMDCIFAVEFSVRVPKTYHIVGFNFDPEYPPMKDYLEKMAFRQTDNTKQVFDEAVENGGITGITWDEVLEFNKGIPWLCNNHVFKAMKAKGLVEEKNYMAWFDKNYRKQRGKYPPACDFLPLPELVKLIKEAGGFALVAHPSPTSGTAGLEDIDYLLEIGIEGLEVWHSDLTEEERARAYKIGLEKNLFISGGSDHSGLCGGFYSSIPKDQKLEDFHLYIPPLSVGTTKEYYEEIKNHKLNRG